MADPPDLAELARRYLDLWREQARLIGDDPVFAGLAESLSKAAKQAADAAAKAKDSKSTGPQSTGQRSTSAAGTAPAAGTARDGEPDGADLARRLAACEARIARLERELAKAGGGTRPAARRRRPGKAD